MVTIETPVKSAWSIRRVGTGSATQWEQNIKTSLFRSSGDEGRLILPLRGHAHRGGVFTGVPELCTDSWRTLNLWSSSVADQTHKDASSPALGIFLDPSSQHILSIYVEREQIGHCVGLYMWEYCTHLFLYSLDISFTNCDTVAQLFMLTTWTLYLLSDFISIHKTFLKDEHLWDIKFRAVVLPEVSSLKGWW